MKKIRFAKTAFLIATGLSLLLGTLLSSNIRGISRYTDLVETGKHILTSLLEMQDLEQGYLLHRQKSTLEKVADKLSELRKVVARHEKAGYAGKDKESLDLRPLEEAINLSGRLFEQFVLYDKAVGKNIAEIIDLEQNILAVIFSKMNPERGIIALQEIRIYEKSYLLYRGRAQAAEGKSFREMRKEAASNLLMWARKDKRIEELMARDNQLFQKIIQNYESLDNALVAMRGERGKIQKIADKLMEEGHKRLRSIRRRSVFLTTMLLLIWLITGVVVASIRFSV